MTVQLPGFLTVMGIGGRQPVLPLTDHEKVVAISGLRAKGIH